MNNADFETYYNLVFGFLTLLSLSVIAFALLYKPNKKKKAEN